MRFMKLFKQWDINQIIYKEIAMFLNIKFNRFIAYYARCIYYAIMQAMNSRNFLHKGCADFSRVSSFANSITSLLIIPTSRWKQI